MAIVFSKIKDIFDEFMYPTFYSYEASFNGKERKYVTIFAYYNESNRKDYYLNVHVNDNLYKRLINGKLDIRSLFANKTKTFFTEGSPENATIIEPIYLQLEEDNYLPERNLYLTRDDDEFLVIDLENVNSELDNSEIVNELFELNIGKQIKSFEYENKEGLMIAFSNAKEFINAESLGILITKTSELFNRVSENLLNLNVLKPFESSFGISLKIDALNLDINDNDLYINRFLNLFNFVSYDNKDDIFNEFLGMYTTKEKDELLNILNELSSNNIEMKSMYYNNVKGIYKASVLKPLKAKEFLNRMHNTIETKRTLNFEKATIYKIDVKNNSFGVIIDNHIYTGKLGEGLQKKEQTHFTVPSENDIVLKEILMKNEFTKKEKKYYILESMN